MERGRGRRGRGGYGGRQRWRPAHEVGGRHTGETSNVYRNVPREPVRSPVTSAPASASASYVYRNVPREPVRSPVTSAPASASASSSSSASEPAVDDPVRVGMQSLQISESSLSNDLVPVKRPDKGGTVAVRTANLRVNHFLVKFNPGSVIRHYDIDVKQEMVSRSGRAGKIPKAKLAMIRDQLFADQSSGFPPVSTTAYDGEKSIFSAVELPTGKFTVDFTENDDRGTRRYVVVVKLVNVLELRKLKEYLSRRLFVMPREVMQGMDVVMKENATRNMISVGRTFHRSQMNREDELGVGLIASRGFQHSLKPTFQGLALCVDYSILPFRKPLPVLEFLMEHIAGFDVNNFGNFRRNVEVALKGLKVTVTHRVTKQRCIISGFTKKNTRHLTFPLLDSDGKSSSQEVSVVNYFREKYGRDIRFKDIPCLDLSKGNKMNYVPMEFCVLVEGQIYPKDYADKNKNAPWELKNAFRKLKDMSLAAPVVRQETICNIIRSRGGPYRSDVIKNFDMEVELDMTSVVGRVIGPPQLKLSGCNGAPINVAVDNVKCHWNLVGKAVVKGRAIERWAVLDFNSYDKRWNCGFLIESLVRKGEKLGIPMTEPLFYEGRDMNVLSSIGMLEQLLLSLRDRAFKICKGKNLQILLCVMSTRHPGYKYLKWISETKVGIVTQCCLSTSKFNDQYLSNLALKINAKLGGSNVELVDRLPYFNGADHVMFVGADVNHPAAGNKSSPSIVAVVATMNWPAANCYAARVRPQYHRKEKIENFGDICLDLVDTYTRLNKVKPGKIVVFRDGVSEGQFDMVLNVELKDLKRAFQSINYTPTVTVIVAQKRHQTRLFHDDGRSVVNVSPGTVVDTKIVHPFEFDFYLCSHYGSLGTSKPTHYHVLWDEHGFTSDQLEKLIYNMCFTFARCTKPVSLIPPVYYADLAAYRGRLYYEALEGQAPSSASSSSSTMSSAVSLDDQFFKLHTDLENSMFFV